MLTLVFGLTSVVTGSDVQAHASNTPASTATTRMIRWMDIMVNPLKTTTALQMRLSQVPSNVGLPGSEKSFKARKCRRLFCESHPRIERSAWLAVPRKAHADRAVASVDIEDFAGDAGGEVGAQKRGRVADVFDRDVALQWCGGSDVREHLA